MCSKPVFSVDAESYGLYGDAFAIGVSVRDPLTNIELDTFFAWHEPGLVRGFDPASDDAQWLARNVPLFTAEVHGKPKDSPKALREAFWEFFQNWKDRGVVVVADCGAPVEAWLFRQCVLDAPGRIWNGPFPLHEAATRRLDKGMDPTGKDDETVYPRLPGETHLHHPLCDARYSGRVWVALGGGPSTPLKSVKSDAAEDARSS